jgi:5-methylthioadenosine/S-adenosylhomocysteine deaminase
MTSIDLLVHARWIIPVKPARQLLQHHAIAVHGGEILALLPQKEAGAHYAPAARCIWTSTYCCPA